MATNWNNELQECRTPERVLEVVNEFLAAQDPPFWSAMRPGTCPEDILSPSEIHRWHHELVQELRRVKPVPIELQELCVLFLRASVRLHQIDARSADTMRPSNDELGCAGIPVTTRLA